MRRTCAYCSALFEIAGNDQEFLRQIDVPVPTLCPACRNLRRLAHINDYILYSRTCDSCGKSFVSTLPKPSAYRVICNHCWYADGRNDRAEGRPYDPSRSFFEQFDTLMHAAPQLGITSLNNENSDYCESIANCRNCYMISECSNCEDSYYSYWIQQSKNVMDCSYVHGCERCYECTDCFNCFGMWHSRNCSQCSDSFFLDQCIGCSHCLLCTNLRHKEYHIFNEPYAPEEYEHLLAEWRLAERSNIQQCIARFAEFLRTQPRKPLQIENAEHCMGNYIRNAKNCYDVYHCYDAEDCSHGEHVWRGAKNCMDANTVGRNAELLYETTNCAIDSYNAKFSRYCWSCRNIEYCNQCLQCTDLFGCVGLKPHARFCILNMQYTEGEYADLVRKIKARMRADGEYGEFFPVHMALFGYNDSIAFDVLQLSQQETLSKGWKWEQQQQATKGKGTIDMHSLPQSIAHTSADVCSDVLTCTACERNYRIIAQEYAFYHELGICVPERCPLCRLRARGALRAPRKLWPRQCVKCQKPIQTTYSPERPEIIYCESCYLQEVY